VNPSPDVLSSDVTELQRLVQDQENRIQDLQSQVAYLTRMLFGRRSEKSADDPKQGLLFGGLETTNESEEGSEEEDEEAPPRRRKRRRHRGRVPLPAHLPRHTHEIHPPDAERTCSCCTTAKKVIGQEVTEELEVIPAKFFVNRYVRYTYACPNGCDGQVSIGTLPPRPIEKGIPGPGFLAHLITSKYSDHLPLYRQQQIYRRHGLEIPRSTMCGWVRYTAFLLSPIVQAMKSNVRASRKIHTDDTPITVLDPAVQPTGSRKGYMWVYVGDHDDVVFDFTNSRNRDGPESFLKGYEGYLQADALSAYNGLYVSKRILEVACWAHARRKYFDAQSTGGTAAAHVLELIGSLYAIERRAKALKITPERLLAWRQKHARRRLARLRAELDRLSLTVLPRSALGKAITYTLKNWMALNRYTDAPFLSIDNNHSERQIKQMVIGRKNWLFAGSEGGAEHAAILFSVIVSCKLADVDPFAYLQDVLTRVGTHPSSRVHELAPREWKKHFAPPEPGQAQHVA